MKTKFRIASISGNWFTTFSDITLLLLTFFVLRYSITIPSTELTYANPSRSETHPDLDVSYALQAIIDTSNTSGISIEERSGDVVLRIDGSHFIDHHALSLHAEELLQSVAAVIREKKLNALLVGSRSQALIYHGNGSRPWEELMRFVSLAESQLLDAGVGISALEAQFYFTSLSDSRNEFDTPMHPNGELRVIIPSRIS